MGWMGKVKATNGMFFLQFHLLGIKLLIAACLFKVEHTMQLRQFSCKVGRTINDAAVQMSANPTNFCTAEPLENKSP